MTTPEEIVAFWLDEIGEKNWYVQDDGIDAKIRDRYEATWRKAREGAFDHWVTSAKGTLGYLILTDQFPRNMFRGSGESFATDRVAKAAAKQAIKQGWDLAIAEPARQFFYLPLMHSENLYDQSRAVRLILRRMPETGDSQLLHARAHRAVIRQFGRFPYRNDALGRRSSPPEVAYLKAGAYANTVRQLQQADAA